MTRTPEYDVSADIPERPEPRPCGPCSLCCKLLNVPELNKPQGKWCEHVMHGKGCAIHATRPAVCRPYQCAWTISPHLPDSWRPDRAGFLAHRSADNALHIFNDDATPNAWRQEPFYSQIKSWSYRTGTPDDTQIIVHSQGKMSVVFPEGAIEVGPESNDPIYSGYEAVNGRRVPYARFGPPPASPTQPGVT